METKIRTCRHLMSNGRNCHSPAMRTSAYCYYHARLHKAKHRPHQSGNPFQLPPLDSPGAILESLHQVMNLLLARKIDPPCAGRLLYGIQMASGKLAGQRKPSRPAPAPAPDLQALLAGIFKTNGPATGQPRVPEVESLESPPQVSRPLHRP